MPRKLWQIVLLLSLPTAALPLTIARGQIGDLPANPLRRSKSEEAFDRLISTIKSPAGHSEPELIAPASTDLPLALEAALLEIQTLGGQPPEPSPDDKREEPKEQKEQDAPSSNGAKPRSGQNRFDPAVVQSGTTAFNNYCTQCHDAQKSTQVKKSLAAWRTTVRRMAEKDGAQIPENTHEAIATYLASLNTSVDSASSSESADATAASPLSITGTFSPWWRFGGSSQLQNPGPFADVWLGAVWQSESPVSGQAVACLSCHNQGNQYGKIDLVQASLRIDLFKALGCKASSQPAVKAAIEGGRFVVPFGAFYQQVNPGVYRSVTRPLIYNMGQRVNIANIGDAVLPMPYSDQGAVLNVAVPFDDTTTAVFDGYVVGGLQGNLNGIDFIASRGYVDNNRSPSIGGRIAVGNKYLRIGGSALGGRFNPDALSGPPSPPMDYVIFGADAIFRYEDIFRVQFEYAERDNDRYGNVPGPMIFRERTGGSYLEGELLLSRHWHLSLFARYDNMLRHSLLPPVGSQLPSGNFNIERITYGLNWSLPGGSLLMFNLEQWYLPSGLANINVAGIRWAAMF